MTSQFSDMTSWPIFFDVVLFLFSSLDTGPSLIQYHYWFWNHDNFLLKGIDQKFGNWKYPRLSFAQYLETRVSEEYQTWYERL